MKHLEHLWQPHHVGPDPPPSIKVAHAAVMQRLGQETSRQGQFLVFVSTTSPSRRITPPNCNSLPLKMMVGRGSFPFGVWYIFRALNLLNFGSVSPSSRMGWIYTRTGCTRQMSRFSLGLPKFPTLEILPPSHLKGQTFTVKDTLK